MLPHDSGLLKKCIDHMTWITKMKCYNKVIKLTASLKWIMPV
jgi:hypothetical protein